MNARVKIDGSLGLHSLNVELDRRTDRKVLEISTVTNSASKCDIYWRFNSSVRQSIHRGESCTLENHNWYNFEIFKK